jgi:hypothetical protein
VAIEPKGKAEWSVVEQDQKEALSQRGKTEEDKTMLYFSRNEMKLLQSIKLI